MLSLCGTNFIMLEGMVQTSRYPSFESTSGQSRVARQAKSRYPSFDESTSGKGRVARQAKSRYPSFDESTSGQSRVARQAESRYPSFEST